MDVTEMLALCVHVLDWSSLYIGFPSDLDSALLNALDDEVELLANRLALHVQNDVPRFLTLLHEGNLASLRIPAADFVSQFDACRAEAKR